MGISSVAPCQAWIFSSFLEYSPDPKQGLATPPVELLLSDLFYLVGAARVVADVVAEDKSFWS